MPSIDSGFRILQRSAGIRIACGAVCGAGEHDSSVGRYAGRPRGNRPVLSIETGHTNHAPYLLEHTHNRGIQRSRAGNYLRNRVQRRLESVAGWAFRNSIRLASAGGGIRRRVHEHTGRLALRIAHRALHNVHGLVSRGRKPLSDVRWTVVSDADGDSSGYRETPRIRLMRFTTCAKKAPGTNLETSTNKRLA